MKQKLLSQTKQSRCKRKVIRQVVINQIGANKGRSCYAKRHAELARASSLISLDPDDRVQDDDGICVSTIG